MSQWDGKSKGTLFGYKVFVFLIKKLGIRSAYSLLIFVSLYYFLFYPANFSAIYYYFRYRQQYSAIQSFFKVYLTYFVFGQTIIDKIAISAGLRNRFTYHFDGIEVLKETLAKGKGGILISAHVGNFEIAEKFLADINQGLKINLVTVDREVSVIKEYLDQIAEKSNIKFIHIQDDLSHIFQINDALSNNELICFTGDRYFEGSKTLSAKLLGRQAEFPTGPFYLASRLGVPVIFVYVMKENNLHYHLYAREAENLKHRDPTTVLRAYTQSLEHIVKRYPLQWFNFFDFWKNNP